jgi:magnesium-transporting ATPase (P-type)
MTDRSGLAEVPRSLGWLIILLLVATAISATLRLIERDAALPSEAIAIVAVVLLNAIMGYSQQSRAEQALMSTVHSDGRHTSRGAMRASRYKPSCRSYGDTA